MNYPTAIDDNSTLYSAADSFSTKTLTTTLAVNALTADVTLQLSASPASLGLASAYGVVSIEDEQIVYTATSGNNLTGCIRGAFGTTAIGHTAGVTVKAKFVRGFIEALKASVIAIETTLGDTGAFNFLLDPGSNGVAARTAQGVVAARTITGGRGMDVTNGTGVSGDPVVARKATVNAQTGTSYTFVDGDGGKLVTGTNASTQAYALPQAGASSLFMSGWFCDIQNRGAGTLTITPATSTIDGATTLALATGQGCRLFSDGTNYFTQRGMGSGSGTQGPQGPQGATGSGTQGPQGTQGNQGNQGTQGHQGDQGVQGAQGHQGSAGAQGPQGDLGLQGPRGFQGDQGERGFDGAPGFDGAQGPQGPQGDTGPQGFQGDQGPPG